ncbi:hypothetical protein CYMTET_55569 [Cymbomonas tetramitiformis]|uniref:Uncharacterized protein n=1 Tax=Cymbomonas tetramitiformis TaxID=36881 RepID=A0AAE0BE10_9CHLO|nr:hypothetical protein CYMTET_55569 [Cymbomonas tetramitiformis]
MSPRPAITFSQPAYASATAPANASPQPASGGATAPATASTQPASGGATAPATASPQPALGGATAPATASPQPTSGGATAPATASPQPASASATAPANHTPHLPSGGVTTAPTTLCEPAAASTPPLGHSADEALVGTPTDHTVCTDGATTADTPTSLSTALGADTTVASEQPPTLGAPDSSLAPLECTYPGLESIGLWADVSDSGSESDTEGYPPQHTPPPPPPPISDTDGTVPAQPTADRATTRATAGTLPALVDTDRLAATSDTHMQPPVPSTVQACAVTPDFHFPPIPESQEDTSETTTKWKQFMADTSIRTDTPRPRPHSSHSSEHSQWDFSVMPSPSFQQLNQFLENYSRTHPSYCTGDSEDDWAQFEVFDDHHLGPWDQY